jgi:shikimate kinase
LAGLLAWNWVDADAVLEQRAGRTIREIFAAGSEAAFRDLESAVLADVCGQARAVVATGGGVVLRAENRARLRQAGRCVWLTADAPTLWQRLQADATTADRRPNLTIGGLTEVEELLRQREPLYRECAGLTVDTARHTPDETARIIRDWWESS